MVGKVYLVGAGPGAPGLITVRALEILKEADVVFYDRLVHPSILEHAGNAKLIYCGKEPGRHVWDQEEINKQMISEALRGKTVVRLKGGDPFIFGRGGEEAVALEKASVPFEVIPGVSSAIAVPAVAGIPLTQRGISSTVAIMTGRQDPTAPSKPVDWDAVSRLETIVILMGVKELPKIVGELSKRRSLRTPVVVISNGTFPNQKIVKGCLEDIVVRCQAAGIKPPAVIVVGQVVKFLEKFSMLDYFPFYGTTVEIIGSLKEVLKWSEYFYNSGAAVKTIAYEKSFSPEFLSTLKRINDFEWVIFYDDEAIEGFFECLRHLRIDIRSLKNVSFGIPEKKMACYFDKYGIFSGVKTFGEKTPEKSAIFVSAPLKGLESAVSVFETRIVKKASFYAEKDPDFTVLLSPSGIRFIDRKRWLRLIASERCSYLFKLIGKEQRKYFKSFLELKEILKNCLKEEVYMELDHNLSRRQI